MMAPGANGGSQVIYRSSSGKQPVGLRESTALMGERPIFPRFIVA